MHRIVLPPDFAAWRNAAREALQQGYAPEQLDLQDGTQPAALDLLSLAALPAAPLPPTARVAAPHVAAPHVPRAFLEAAQMAAVHRDPQRWNLLYRLLYRLQSQRNLLRIEVDDDVARLKRLEAQVRRDLHKMHAFVRFRKTEEGGSSPQGAAASGAAAYPEAAPDMEDARRMEASPPMPVALQTEAAAPSEGAPTAAGPSTGVTTTEHFIAWYRPDHRILRLAAPFFAERFAPMRWTILTADESVTWDPQARQLTFFPGTGQEAAPREDELEALWKSYYGAIFNPARLNPAAMRAELPVRYWQNLPEAALIPGLMQRAGARVNEMVARQAGKASAAPFLPADHSLAALRTALPGCQGCDLYRHATQVVPGAGDGRAALMLVGEQPGDQEDRQGTPFVGPAGGVLRQALEETGIAPGEVYMTNAVKHFKFVQRGKLRLHQNPRLGEITACRPWLAAEIEAVQPRVILCLGASAAKSLLGGTFALMRERGVFKQTTFAERVMATVHPSAVLRAQDEAGRARLYGWLREDLALAYRTAAEFA